MLLKAPWFFAFAFYSFECFGNYSKGGDEKAQALVDPNRLQQPGMVPQADSSLNSLSCPLLFTMLRRATTRYVKNIIFSGGLRIPFKPVNDIAKHVLPGQRWLGLWTPAENTSKVMKALDGYYLRQGVPLVVGKMVSGRFYNITPQHFLAQLSKKVLNGRSYTFSFPAHMWVYAKTWAPIVSAGIAYQAYLTWEVPHENELRENIEKDPEFWNELIRSDLRFDFIKKKLVEDKITPENRFMAAKKLESIKLYFNTIATDEFLKLNADEREAVLLDNPLFAMAKEQEDPEIRSKVIRNIEYTQNLQALIPELVRSGFFYDSNWTVQKMGSNAFLDLVKKSPLLESTIESFRIPVYSVLGKLTSINDGEYDGSRLKNQALMQQIVLNISQLLQELQMRANVGAISEKDFEVVKNKELTELLSYFIDQNLKISPKTE
jgi:hypothetical protein